MCFSKAHVRWAAVMAGMAVMTVLGPAARAGGPQGIYTLTVKPENAPPEAGAGASVSLWCDPDGGTHARASDACDQLEQAGGTIALIPAQPGACTREFAPVTVRAQGMWNGRTRQYEKTFPNKCIAVRETGGVLFRF